MSVSESSGRPAIAEPPEASRGGEPRHPAECGGRLLLLLAAPLLLFHLLIPRVHPLGTAGAAVALPAASFLLPALVWAGRGSRWRKVFPLGKVAPGLLLRSASLAAGASLLALAAAGLLSRLFPSAGLEEEALYRFVRSVPLPEALLLFALWPALCEEALFRGALVDGLRGLSPASVCFLSGAAFGLFHGSLLRFFPVALLGAALAAVVLRTGNWGLAVLFHALHNGAILLLAAPPDGGKDPVALPAALGLALLVWGLGPFEGGGRAGRGKGGAEEPQAPASRSSSEGGT